MAFLLVKGIKTRSSLAFFGLGIFCSLISYEYENFKPAPLYAVGFLALLGLWQLLPAVRRGLRAARDAILTISRKAWRPALAFTLAAGITAGPMLVGAHLGKDVYLSSLHRQENDRHDQGNAGPFCAQLEATGKVGRHPSCRPGPTRRMTCCLLSICRNPCPRSDIGDPGRRGGSSTPASGFFIPIGYSSSAGSWRRLRAAPSCYRTGRPGNSWASCPWALC